MRNPTNLTSPSSHNNYSRPRPQNWPSPPSRLTSRSATRTRPHHGLNPFDLTKTCPLRPNSPNSTFKLNTPYYFRHHIYPHRRLRRTESNTTPQNSCILINCPPGLNNPCSTIFPVHHTSYPPNLLHYDIFDISRL